MPKYTTKKAAIAKRRQKTVTKSISRDKRILKRWAATGSAADYEKLRKYATKLADKAPDYVLPDVLRLLQTTDRRRLVEAIHADGNTGDTNFVNQGLAWIINAMPTKNMKWAAQLQLNTMKGHTGDGVTEQDEDYAKLIRHVPRRPARDCRALAPAASVRQQLPGRVAEPRRARLHCVPGYQDAAARPD